MNTLEFLQRVLPSDGFYCTTIINKDVPPRQGFFNSVDDLSKAVVYADNKGHNVYYAISSFKEKGSRKQENVHATKVVALDIDCGPNKGYATFDEGVHALSNFAKVLELPRPYIVHSGHGLHVYWVLTEALTPDDWFPLANALKAAAHAHDFKVDAGLTANNALVLRPIGTHNRKDGTPQSVHLLMEGDPVAPKDLGVRLAQYFLAGTAQAKVKATRGKVSSRALSPLATAIAGIDEPTANAAVILTKCQQIGWAVANPSKVLEPLWYDLLGVAAYCADPDNTALAWSAGHPEFNANNVLAKLAQWKAATTGPTTCDKFDTDNPGVCKGCPYHGKIGTPVRLGVQHVAIAAPEDAPEQVDTTLPKRYKRTSHGIMVTQDGVDLEVCDFDIYPTAYGKDHEHDWEVLRFQWRHPHSGWQPLNIRRALLSPDMRREFAMVINDQGIDIRSRAQVERFQTMLHEYMAGLRRKTAPVDMHTSMGWKENYTQFVIGDTLFRHMPDGTVNETKVDLSSTVSGLATEFYAVNGEHEEWLKLTQVLNQAQLYMHVFALCVSLSAPFYAFSGLNGTTVSLYGPTGCGKTLAQLLAQSVWGNPRELHKTAKATQNALFSRMGFHRHLPFTIDEITTMSDREITEFLYWVSQGQDKIRLSRTAKERELKEFAMPVIVSTNLSLNGKLLLDSMSSNAQLVRLLEVRPTPSRWFSTGSNMGQLFYQCVHTNYGHTGRAFLKKLLEHDPSTIRAMIADAKNKFQSKYQARFTGEERYWEQTYVCADLAGRLGTEWGLMRCDYIKGVEWALLQIGAIRREVVANKRDSFDTLNEYINETADFIASVVHTGTRAQHDHERLSRSGKIYIRFDLYRKNAGDPPHGAYVHLHRTHFRTWLTSKGYDYTKFKEDMEAEGILTNNERLCLGKDTGLKVGQQYVIGVSLNHPRLQDIIGKMDNAALDAAVSNVVQLKP